jgi:tetratricopeptide (TPR) repeat protein
MLRCLNGRLVCLVLVLVVPVAAASCSGDKMPEHGSEQVNLETSIADLTEQIRLDPHKADDRGDLACHKRGTLHAERGEHDKAIADYTDAIRLYPAIKASFLAHHMAGAHNDRAKCYEKVGEQDKAIADYTEVLRIAEKGKPDASDVLLFEAVAAQAHYRRGLCYDEKNQHDKALADYKEAVRIEPDLANNEDLKQRMDK